MFGDKAKAYHHEALEALKLVLHFYPGTSPLLLPNFAGIDHAIDRDRKDGAAPVAAALNVAASIFRHFLERLPVADRHLMADELTTVDPEEFREAIAVAFTDGKMHFPMTMHHATILIGGAVVSASQYAETGQLDAADLDAFLDAIDRALLDITAEGDAALSLKEALERIAGTAPAIAEREQDIAFD